MNDRQSDGMMGEEGADGSLLDFNLSEQVHHVYGGGLTVSFPFLFESEKIPIGKSHRKSESENQTGTEVLISSPSDDSVFLLTTLGNECYDRSGRYIG